jgi:rfaE bifunctional protein kinase chain/domain
MSSLRERLQKARVLVVGDAMLDRYLFGDVERISPEAPVPVVRVTREEERLGGAANVALNAKSLGPSVTLITVVGDDEPARKLQQLLKAQDVDSILGRDPKLYTCVKLRIIGRAQQLVRVDFENQPDHEILAGMLSDFAREVVKHDAVLFSDYGKGGLAHIPHMIEMARAAGKPVLVDPKGSDYSRYAGATAITPNRAELAQVIGPWQTEAQLSERAQALRIAQRLDALLLTRSEEGMTLFDAAGHVHVQTQAREVFDVTGAGDTVIATLAVMLAAGMGLREAMPIANRAGGIVVGKFGTATVTYDELFQ